METNQPASRQLPWGIRLLSYGMMLIAVAQSQEWLHIVKGTFEKDTFLGFSAPTPLPHIEFIVSWGLYIYCGFGMLKRKPLARTLLQAMLLISGLAVVAGTVTGVIALRNEASMRAMAGSQVPAAEYFWIVWMVISLLILAALFVYTLKIKKYFEPGQEMENVPVVSSISAQSTQNECGTESQEDSVSGS